MLYLLFRHKVADFTKWERAYRAQVGARQLAGLTELHLLRGIGDPNEVVILFAANDLNTAKILTSSPEIRSIIQNSGVIGKPDFVFLNRVNKGAATPKKGGSVEATASRSRPAKGWRRLVTLKAGKRDGKK